MTRILTSSRDLGRLLADYRRRRSLTQSQLATRAGITQATVSKIERGVSQATVETLFRMLAVLELELTVDERDATPPPSPWDRS